MKRSAFLLLLIACFGSAGARQHTHSSKSTDCSAAGYHAVQQIPRLSLGNKTDSLDVVMIAWKKECPVSEPMISFAILHEIGHKTFYTRKETQSGDNDWSISAHELYGYKQQIAAYRDRYIYSSDPDRENAVKDSDTIATAYNDYYIRPLS